MGGWASRGGFLPNTAAFQVLSLATLRLAVARCSVRFPFTALLCLQREKRIVLLDGSWLWRSSSYSSSSGNNSPGGHPQAPRFGNFLKVLECGWGDS